MNTMLRNAALSGRKGLLAAIPLALLVITGCTAPAKVIVTQAPQGQGGCTSFGWPADGGQPASFMDQWIRAESLSILEAKGYTIADENPACVVSYALSSQPRRSGGTSVGLGAGGGSGNFGGGVGISLPVGGSRGTPVSMTLNIVDTGQRAQVWGASLDRALPSATPQEIEVRMAVQRILAEFPVQSLNR